MYKVEREDYEKFWMIIAPLQVWLSKYEKFSERMKDFIIYKNLEGKYISLDEYVEASKAKASEADKAEASKETKEDKVSTDGNEADSAESHEDDKSEEEEEVIVYDVSDEKQQSQYINMFKEEGLDALILTHNIDQPFISHVEYKNQKVKFQRIDADITDRFKDETQKKDKKILKKNTEAMTKLFRKTQEWISLKVR